MSRREWYDAVLADLKRIKGIDDEMVDLLVACGIDSLHELAMRSPVRLRELMIEQNERQKLVRRLPSEALVTSWVAEAKQMEAR